MVITDRFVYIHMPKTGGTFVTEVLSRLHGADDRSRSRVGERWRSVARRMGFGDGGSAERYGPMTDVEPKHGTCRDIPEAHRAKPVLSTVRNPFEWYVSQYEFGWWKRTSLYYPEAYPTPAGYAIGKALPEFQDAHPHFPEVSFPDFIELCDRAAAVYSVEPGNGVGLYTQGFVRYYCTDAAEALSGTDRHGALTAEVREMLHEVHFVDTARVASDLAAYLLLLGYRREDLAFIAGLGRILPMGIGRREDQRWEDYYTPELKAHIRGRDRVLFELFPDFDV